MITLIVSFIFTGCSAKEDASKKVNTGEVGTNAKVAEEKVKLKMTIFGSENDETVYRERLDLARETYDNIEVDLIYIPGTDYATKLQAMIAGGTAPDIMQLAEDVHGYSAKNQIVPLNEFAQAENIDLSTRFGTGYKTYERDGNVYAMPDRGGTMVVYYNKDMFDAKGIDYPTKDWTWDDLLDAAQQLTVKNGDEVEVYGFAAGDWWPWWMSFMYQNGGRILDDNNNVVVDSPENMEALQFYNDLVYKHQVAPSKEDYANMGDKGPDPLFAQGKVAIEITGFWNIGSLNNVPDLNWDIAPVWQNKERATVAFGSGLAISKDCKYKEEAFKIIEFLTSEEGQLPIVTNKQDAPANKKVLESDAFLKAAYANSDINMDAFAENADAIMSVPIGPHWNELEQVCKDNLSELFSNLKDAETVLKELQADLEDVMSRY